MELRYRDSGDESVGRHEGLGAVCCPNSPMSRSRWSGNDQRGECVARWPDPGRVDDPRGRLGAYRFGRPLVVDEMRFSRTDSAEAIALSWLAVGGPRTSGSPTGWWLSRPSAMPRDTRPPVRRPVLGAADLLPRLSGSDHYEMGRLM